jgi:hypothetical protein
MVLIAFSSFLFTEICEVLQAVITKSIADINNTAAGLKIFFIIRGSFSVLLFFLNLYIISSFSGDSQGFLFTVMLPHSNKK